MSPSTRRSGGRLVESLLYGTTASDPLVLSAAALAMMVALLSTLLPARTASQADPSVLLRTT